MKVQNNFLKENDFLTYSWIFLISNKLEQLNSNWKNLSGFRNMQHEKFKKKTLCTNYQKK